VTPVAHGQRPPGSPTQRIFLVVVLAVVALVFTAGPAAAHTELISTTPVDQQTVGRTPPSSS